MKKINVFIPISVSYFFILLFCYAGASKLKDFENFQVQIAQSPLFGTYAGAVSYATIISEVIIVLLLIIPRARTIGLYVCLSIMTAFTLYIYIILNYSDSIPCSCGGILEKMDWNQHLFFNLTCVLLAIIAIIIRTSVDKGKLISYLGIAILLPLAVLTAVFYPHIYDNQGTFTRKIIEPLDAKYKTLEFPMNNYYIAGNYGDTLFLGNRKTPLLLSTIRPDFNSVKIDKIKLDNYNYQFVSVTIDVLYPYFSVSDGNVPVIFEGKLPSLTAYDTEINRLYFSRFYMLEPKRYIFKTMLVKTKANELGILNTASKKYVIVPNVLETKVDGVFDTDGDITVDRKNKKIIYTHFYRNEIITTDFDLQNIQRSPTIDSLSNTKIETRTLENGQTKLLRSPSVINSTQAVFDDKFFNVSRMRGINESFKDFRNNYVIDVYNVHSKKYLYSFYIKNQNRNKIRGILSTKNYFYVLSSDAITRYTFK